MEVFKLKASSLYSINERRMSGMFRYNIIMEYCMILTYLILKNQGNTYQINLQRIEKHIAEM